MNEVIFLSFIYLFLASCSFLKVWQIDNPDNFIEETIEDIIEEQTNVKVDLTPFTGEENQSF